MKKIKAVEGKVRVIGMWVYLSFANRNSIEIGLGYLGLEQGKMRREEAVYIYMAGDKSFSAYSSEWAGRWSSGRGLKKRIEICLTVDRDKWTIFRRSHKHGEVIHDGPLMAERFIQPCCAL